jgi:hypothetical protein
MSTIQTGRAAGTISAGLKKATLAPNVSSGGA